MRNRATPFIECGCIRDFILFFFVIIIKKYRIIIRIRNRLIKKIDK